MSVQKRPNLADTQKRANIAAYRAKHLYPGPIGELVSRELYSWAEFGYALGGQSLAERLAQEVLAQEWNGVTEHVRNNA